MSRPPGAAANHILDDFDDDALGFDALDDFAPLDASASALSSGHGAPAPFGQPAPAPHAEPRPDPRAGGQPLRFTAPPDAAAAHRPESEMAHDPELDGDPYSHIPADPLDTGMAEAPSRGLSLAGAPHPAHTASVQTASAHSPPAYSPPAHNPPAFNPVGEMVATASQRLTDVSVPRITIHIFAERQDTLAAADRAGQDRRLSRATTQIRVGGIEGAIETYASEPTPPLIIVECLAPPMELLTQVDRLAEVCDMGTKVVVIAGVNDIMLYRELMRRGVSEYMVAPVQPLQLIEAIGGLFSDPSRPFTGRSIAFVGARGGSGSSAVAHNTAYALSEKIGANTVIVDYDLPFGTAGLDFNQDPIHGVADALGQPDRLDATLLDRMMVRCSERLSLFAAPASLDGDWDVSPDAFEEVTSRIRTTAPFVVLDLPHLWSGWMRRTLISADEVVVVATPDLAALRNAKNMVDLVRQSRPNDAPPRLVLNQVGMPGRPEIPAKDFGAALGIHPAMIIPFDAKLFGQAANNGQMVLEANAKSKAAEAFVTLAQIVSNREVPQLGGPAAPRAKGSLFGKLFSRKKG